MELYWISCLLVVSVLCIQCEALGKEDCEITKNIETKVWCENGGPPCDNLEDGTVQVVILATEEFKAGIVYSSTTTRINCDGKFELVFNTIDEDGTTEEIVRVAEEVAPGTVVIPETGRHVMYMLNWKEHGIAANYQWIEKGDGVSHWGIIKINPNTFNPEHLCEAIQLFGKSGLCLDLGRQFAYGRDENGELQYLEIRC